MATISISEIPFDGMTDDEFFAKAEQRNQESEKTKTIKRKVKLETEIETEDPKETDEKVDVAIEAVDDQIQSAMEVASNYKTAIRVNTLLKPKIIKQIKEKEQDKVIAAQNGYGELKQIVHGYMTGKKDVDISNLDNIFKKVLLPGVAQAERTFDNAVENFQTVIGQENTTKEEIANAVGILQDSYQNYLNITNLISSSYNMLKAIPDTKQSISGAKDFIEKTFKKIYSVADDIRLDGFLDGIVEPLDKTIRKKIDELGLNAFDSYGIATQKSNSKALRKDNQEFAKIGFVDFIEAFSFLRGLYLSDSADDKRYDKNVESMISGISTLSVETEETKVNSKKTSENKEDKKQTNITSQAKSANKNAQKPEKTEVTASEEQKTITASSNLFIGKGDGKDFGLISQLQQLANIINDNYNLIKDVDDNTYKNMSENEQTEHQKRISETKVALDKFEQIVREISDSYALLPDGEDKTLLAKAFKDGTFVAKFNKGISEKTPYGGVVAKGFNPNTHSKISGIIKDQIEKFVSKDILAAYSVSDIMNKVNKRIFENNKSDDKVDDTAQPNRDLSFLKSDPNYSAPLNDKGKIDVDRVKKDAEKKIDEVTNIFKKLNNGEKITSEVDLDLYNDKILQLIQMLQILDNAGVKVNKNKAEIWTGELDIQSSTSTRVVDFKDSDSYMSFARDFFGYQDDGEEAETTAKGIFANDAVQKKLKNKEEENQKLKEDLKEKDKKIKELESNTIKQEKIIDSKNKEINQARADRDEAKRELRSRNSHDGQANSKSVKDELIKSQEENTSLIKEKENLEKENENLREEIKKLNDNTTVDEQQTPQAAAVVEEKTSAFVEEQKIVEDVIDNEIKKINELSEALSGVIDKVNEKNEAFKTEGEIVGEVIDEEKKDINSLSEKENNQSKKKKSSKKKTTKKKDDGSTSDNTGSEDNAEEQDNNFHVDFHKIGEETKENIKKILKRYTENLEDGLELTGSSIVNNGNSIGGTLTFQKKEEKEGKIFTETFRRAFVVTQSDIEDFGDSAEQACKTLKEFADDIDEDKYEVKIISERLDEKIGSIKASSTDKTVEDYNSNKATPLLIKLENVLRGITGARGISTKEHRNTLLEGFETEINGKKIDASGEHLKSLIEGLFTKTERVTDKEIDQIKLLINALERETKEYKDQESAATSSLRKKSVDSIYNQQVTKFETIQEKYNSRDIYTQDGDLKNLIDDANTKLKNFEGNKNNQQFLRDYLDLIDEITAKFDQINKKNKIENDKDLFGIKWEQTATRIRLVKKELQELNLLSTVIYQDKEGNDITFEDKLLEIEKTHNNNKDNNNALKTTNAQLTLLNQQKREQKKIIEEEAKATSVINNTEDLQNVIVVLKEKVKMLEQEGIAKEKIKQLNQELKETEHDITNVLSEETFKSKKEKVLNLEQTIGVFSANPEKGYALDTKFINFKKSFEEYMSKNSKIRFNSGLNEQFKKLAKDILAAEDALDYSEETLKKFINRFAVLQSETSKKGLLGKNVFDSFTSQVGNLISNHIGTAAAAAIGNYVRQMIEAVKQIDAAMTEVKKVTNDTEKAYSDFIDNVGLRAEALGTSMTALIASTADFAKIGYGLNDAAKLAENATIYANVGDLDIQTATNDLISVTKAFDFATDETSKIVDSFNEVGNNFAVSAQQLGEGLRNSASSMVTAGNTMDETIAMITAMTEITQDASSAGSALKILSLRIRGAKTELEDMGENTEDMAVSTSKLRKQIKAMTGGFDIMKNDSEFKSTYEIMGGLAEAVKNMDDISKTALIEKIAGKNRANQIAALLNNWSQAEKALETSLNAAGSAAKENAAYIDSIAGKISQLKASFEDLSNDIINSELFKFIIDAINFIVKGIDNIVETSGSLPFLLGAGLVSLQAKKVININDLINIDMFKKDASETAQDISETLSDNIADGIGQGMANGIQQGEQTAEATSAISGLFTGLKTAGIVLAISLIAAALEGIRKTWFNTIENTKEKIDELTDECNKVNSEIEEINAQLEENQRKIEEINNDPLKITRPEDLIELKNQNEELLIQKQTLEDIAELKKQQISNETEKLIDLNTYRSDKNEQNYISAIWEQARNGQWLDAIKTQNEMIGVFKHKEDDPELDTILKYLGNSALGNSFGLWGPLGFLGNGGVFGDTRANVDAVTKTEEMLEELERLYATKNKSFVDDDFINYSKAKKDIEQVNNSLAETLVFLSEQQKQLDENSELYKEINNLMQKYSDIQSGVKDNNKENDDSNTKAHKTRQQLFNTYASIEGFDEGYEKFREKIDDKFESRLYGTLGNISSENYLKLKSFLDEDYIKTEKIGQKIGVEVDTYKQMYNIINKINKLQQDGLISTNQELIQFKKGLMTIGNISEDDIIYLDFHLKKEAYDAIDSYNIQNLDNGFSSINASNYITYYEELVNDLISKGINTNIVEEILASIFPDYQTTEGLIYSYFNENINSAFSNAIKDFKSGKLTVDELTEFLSTDKMSSTLDSLGISAEAATGYIKQLVNELINEEKAAMQAATATAKVEFNTLKTTYDTDFSPTRSTFSNAISSINSDSSISYEDMWTLINADDTLATEFKKSADGYTISVDKLTEAQERYVKETKDEFLKNIDDAQKRIADTEAKKAEAQKRVANVRNSGDGLKITAEIAEYNQIIADENLLIAQNKLMYEEASSSVQKYVEELENLSDKLSTFKSLYEQIANEMSKMGHIGADSIIDIMNAFPQDWQKMLKQDGSSFTVDTEAYTQTVVAQLGYSGSDETTILKDITSDVEEKLRSLANEYNLTYNASIPLAEQFNNLRNQAGAMGVASSDFGSRINSLNEEFSGLGDTASIVAEIIALLIDTFKESKHIADFNSEVSDLQRQLDMGEITQVQYDVHFRNLANNFENSAKENGISDVATQDLINDNATSIHTADQNRYQKELDKQTQALEDAYNQRLINADEYYTQLKVIEDKYYGTETSRGLLDDPDQVNVDNKNRTQTERKSTIADNEIERIKNEYTQGLFNFTDVETKLFNSVNKWLGENAEFADRYANSLRDINAFLYEQEITISDRALEKGAMTTRQYAEEMRRVWEKYYKDKQGYAEESYQAEQKFLEAAKSDIQQQIDGIENLINQNEEYYNSQIEAIEKQNEEIEKHYDSQIQDLEEQIDEIDKKADEEQRYLNILEAEENLKKAKRNRRMVVDEYGNRKYIADTDAINSAQKELDDLKKEEEKDKIQEEIDKLETEKESKLEENNLKIQELNEKLETLNKPLSDLVTVLAANLAESYNIDPEIIGELLTTDASKEALKKMQETQKQSGQKETTEKDLNTTAQNASEQNDTNVSKEEKNKDITDVYDGKPSETGKITEIDGKKYKIITNMIQSFSRNLSTLISETPINENYDTNKFIPDYNSTVSDIANFSTENMSISIGEIVISNPVGDTMNLAKEIQKQLPNAIVQQIYKNR